MKNNEKDFIIKYIQLLGYTKEEATIYTNVLLNPLITILELSRISKIERTKIYRELEELQEKHLLKIITRNEKKYIIPCSIEEIKKQINILSARYNEIIDNYQIFENLYSQFENSEYKSDYYISDNFDEVKKLLIDQAITYRLKLYVIDNNTFKQQIMMKLKEIPAKQFVLIHSNNVMKNPLIIFNNNIMIIKSKSKPEYKIIWDKELISLISKNSNNIK